MINESIGLLVLIIIVFICGFGWGQWFSERQIRKENAHSETNRLIVSMPMNTEDSSNALGLLKDIIDKVKHDKE